MDLIFFIYGLDSYVGILLLFGFLCRGLVRLYVFLCRGLIHQTHLFEYINNLSGFGFSCVRV